MSIGGACNIQTGIGTVNLFKCTQKEKSNVTQVKYVRFIKNSLIP